MANFLQKLFGRGSTKVVGIDIGSSSIKVVQLSRKSGHAVLETYGELALGPYADVEIGRATNLPTDKLSQALADVLRESKITSPNAGVAIPFSKSLVTVIEVPPVPPEQLPQIMKLEAKKYIPVPIEEVMLDWMIVVKSNGHKPLTIKDSPEEGPQKQDVLLVAIHNSTLSEYQTIITQAKVSATFFEIEIFSAIRSVLDQDTSTQMIIDVGAANTKVYIVEHGIVHISHTISRGSQDVTLALAQALGVPVEDAEVMKRDTARIPSERRGDFENAVESVFNNVFIEAHQVILNYQKRFNKDVSRVVMVGGGARLQHVFKLAEKNLETTVVLGDPFGKTESPAFLEEVLKKTGPEFAVAVGIALRKLQESR
jgi:type IV pilus assembly protein PilM